MGRNDSENWTNFDHENPLTNLLAASVLRLKRDLEHPKKRVRESAENDLINPDPEWLEALESAGLGRAFSELKLWCRRS